MAENHADERGDVGLAALRHGHRHRGSPAGGCGATIWPAGLCADRAGRFDRDGRIGDVTASAIDCAGLVSGPRSPRLRRLPYVIPRLARRAIGPRILATVTAVIATR